VGGNFGGTEYLYYPFMLLYFLFIFSLNILYFRPPSFPFILLAAVISIIEQRDEFYDKRTFLMGRRRVFI